MYFPAGKFTRSILCVHFALCTVNKHTVLPIRTCTAHDYFDRSLPETKSAAPNFGLLRVLISRAKKNPKSTRRARNFRGVSSDELDFASAFLFTQPQTHRSTTQRDSERAHTTKKTKMTLLDTANESSRNFFGRSRLQNQFDSFLFSLSLSRALDRRRSVDQLFFAFGFFFLLSIGRNDRNSDVFFHNYFSSQ